MKTLLISINAKYIHTNNAVRLLKANCNFDVDILEYTIKDSIDDIIKDIHTFKPDILGFSAYIWNINIITEIIDNLSLDGSKIVVGGQGTGGYVALGLAAVDKRSEIEAKVKFQRGDFTPMVSVDTLGDWNGLGGWGYLNYSGDSAVSGNAHMVFNYGGAMGDSSWMDASTLPIIGMHCPTDFFAPYRTGNVIVPTTGVTVINSASGAGAVVPFANSLGINDKINACCNGLIIADLFVFPHIFFNVKE